MLFYVGLHDGKLYSSAAGGAYDLPRFRGRQVRTFALRFLNSVDGVLREEDLHIRSFRASIGWIGRHPQSGGFKIKIGTGAAVAGVNTTGVVDWSVDQARLEACLNELTIGGEFRVVRTATGWLIRRVDGAFFDLAVVENTLRPVSVGNVEGMYLSGVWHQHLEFFQTPLAAATDVDRVLPPAPKISRIVEGFTDASGTFYQNEVQRFKMPVDFRAQFYFRYNHERTGLLSIDDGIEQYKVELNRLFARQGGVIDVRLPESRVVDIEFAGDLAGFGMDLLEVVVPPEGTPLGDYTFSMDLGLWPMLDALREGDVVDVPFEVRAVVVDRAEDIGDPDVQGREIVLFHLPISVLRPVLFPALDTVKDIPWLRGASPQTYVPSVPSQILTGQQQGFLSVIGDGVKTEWVINHNLNSDVAYVVVRENMEGGRMLRDDEYEVRFEGANSLAVVFPAAPGVDGLRVFVLAVGPASVFQAHAHTIGQVTGLLEWLDSLTDRVVSLEDILPSIDMPAEKNEASGIKIDLPRAKNILYWKGDAASAFTEAGLKIAADSRAPMMLPALHVADVVDYVGGDLPDAESHVGVVWQNVSGEVLPLGRGVVGGVVPLGGYFGSDGRVCYAVRAFGETKSYYPIGFEVELWRIFVNEQMLRMGRKLEVRWDLAFQLARATSNAHWLLVLEKGMAPSQELPAVTGGNLENVVWDATPMLSQRIILTQNRQTHRFGARIARAVDAIRCDTMLYGVWNEANAHAPASANFILRARLINFDTENNLAADARGWIAYEMMGSGGKQEENEANTQPQAWIA